MMQRKKCFKFSFLRESFSFSFSYCLADFIHSILFLCELRLWMVKNRDIHKGQ